MDMIFTFIQERFGMSAIEFAGALALTSTVFQFVSKVIPDDKKGVLGVIRKISKVGGLYISNRVNSHYTVEELAIRSANKVNKGQ